MTGRTHDLLELYAQKLASQPKAPPSVDPVLSAYREAAAVLHRFSPDVLAPSGDVRGSRSARLVLFDDIEAAPGDEPNLHFALKLDVRRAALRRLRTRATMLGALEANPDRPHTALQAMWEDYLRTGQFPRVESLGYGGLINLCQILAWLDGIHDGLPAQEQVLDLVRRKSVLATFEHLITQEFTGREQELSTLRSYMAGSLPAPSAGAPRKSILVLHGSGGIGKTALIGKLLLEYAQANDDTRVPFAYLPFDQRSLRIDAPVTLLLESASQLEVQFPEQRGVVQHFRDITGRSRVAQAAFAERRRGSHTRGERIHDVMKEDELAYHAFGDMVQELGQSISGTAVVRPVLIVFDTFEEVQYRDREALSGFWRMLDVILDVCESLRVIISGRGPIATTGGPTSVLSLEQMNLAELTFRDSVSLLQRLGISDLTVAQKIAEQVGGSPLSLSLAARVVKANPAGVDGLMLGVDAEIIQGQLYRRILNHIHDENVRKLAHPGMVLRRVTPDVILEVLAPVLLPSVTEREQAVALFAELEREHALTTMDQGALVYRPEIRRSMVRLLQQDQYATVRELRRAAIAYYEEQEGPLARAEEMYHRLALGEDETYELDSRWLTGIEQSVAASLDEYPDRMKAWLASRASVEVPRSVFELAGAGEWERNITRKVQRALSELQMDWALTLMRERAERTEASPLFALETKAHLLQGNLAGAEQCVTAGIQRVEASNNRGRLAELFWLRSQVEMLRQEPLAAERSLAMAEKAIERAKNPIPLTHVLCHRLLLRRLYPASYGERTPDVRLRLARACGNIEESTAYQFAFVVRLAFALLEQEHPEASERLGRWVEPAGPAFAGDPLTSENLQGLDEYREPWELDMLPMSQVAP